MIRRRTFLAAALAPPFASRAQQKCPDLTLEGVEEPSYKPAAPYSRQAPRADR